MIELEGVTKVYAAGGRTGLAVDVIALRSVTLRLRASAAFE